MCQRSKETTYTHTPLAIIWYRCTTNKQFCYTSWYKMFLSKHHSGAVIV